MNRRLFDECEREALAFSGAIQPHGALLRADADGRVTHVSANIAEFVDAPHGAAEQWLGETLPETLQALIAHLPHAAGRRAVFSCAVDGVHGALDLSASRSADGAAVLEFTRAQAVGAGTAPSFHAADEPTPADAQALLQAQNALVGEILERTGFQRVMLYQFRDDGDGEVVAEARDAAVYGSYLGLRFPASDIPQVARQLYLCNPWRLIPDAAAEPVAVLGRDAEPPDLTHSDLRSASPVHRIYLGNMDVAASLSFPVVVGGALEALVAAHNQGPRELPVELLEALAARVRAHAFAVGSFRAAHRMRMIDGLERRFVHLQDVLQRHGDLPSAWPEVGDWLVKAFRVDGAMLCVGDAVMEVGTVFEPDALQAFSRWFEREVRDYVWAGDHLALQAAGYPLSEIAGALAVRADLRGIGPGRLYLLRCEHIHEVAWGGNPEKPVERHDGIMGVAPRRSFERWVEKRLGYSRPWDNEARLMALKLRELLLKA